MEKQENEDWTIGLEKPQSEYLKVGDKQNAIIEFIDDGKPITNNFGDEVINFKVKVSIIQTTVDTPQGNKILDDNVNAERTLSIKRKSYSIIKQLADRKKAKNLIGTKASYSRTGNTAKDTRYTLKFFDEINVEKTVIQ